jgi:hypothetical protein
VPTQPCWVQVLCAAPVLACMHMHKHMRLTHSWRLSVFWMFLQQTLPTMSHTYFVPSGHVLQSRRFPAFKHAQTCNPHLPTVLYAGAWRRVCAT